MFPIKKIAKKREHVAVDKRIWWMIMAVGFLGFLVMKEISLPSSVVLAFGAMGLMGLLVVGVQNPEMPLYALIIYIPFSRILVGDFGTQMTAFNMTNILCLWILIAHVMRQMSVGKPITQGTVLNRIIIFYCLMGVAALMRASFTYGSWYAGAYLISMKRWLTPMLFYFLTLWVVRDRRVLKTCVVLIMAAVTIVALMAIRDYSYVGSGGFEKSRVGGIVDQSNTLGAFFVYYMFLFMGFFFVFPKKNLKVWLLLIPFLLCFRGIMVTFSRGAYIAFAFAMLGLLWFRNKLMFMAAMAVIILMVANPMFMPAGIRYRFSGTVEQSHVSYINVPLEETLEASAATRIRIWKGAAQMIKEHPWWGVGYGAFPSFISRYTKGVIGRMDAHNSYILIAAEMGIPSLLIFLMILITATYYTYWLYRNAKDPSMRAIALGFLGGLAGLAMANMFGSRMDSQQAAGYFWVLCGLIMRGVVLERADQRLERKGK